MRVPLPPAHKSSLSQMQRARRAPRFQAGDEALVSRVRRPRPGAWERACLRHGSGLFLANCFTFL